MASACVNPPPSPPNLLDSPPPSSWFTASPRISFSHDFVLNQDLTKSPRNGDLDFEFRLDEICSGSKNFSPADELFADGKLMPLHLASSSIDNKVDELKDCEEEEEKIVVVNEIFDKCEVSPKAPKCSWKEFLGLKRSQNPNLFQKSSDSSVNYASKNSKSLKSLKFFSKSSSNSSMNHPLLLKDLDTEVAEAVSRRSLSSSSSSSHDHDDNPRLSLDSEKQPNLPKLKVGKTKLQKPSTSRSNRVGGRVGRSAARRAAAAPEAGSRGVSVDSPRMNSSGKIVFSSLERSSSSPSTFNGGPRLKARGMERSYSANVRIRPVLNVPICSLRGSSSGKSGSVFGFGQLFSSHKKDGVRQQSIKRNGSGNNR
ncbi:hypothetical protein ACHQM5_017940 [Ranunculus cassubicifolius]